MFGCYEQKFKKIISLLKNCARFTILGCGFFWVIALGSANFAFAKKNSRQPAQTSKVQSAVQNGRVLNEGAYVYKFADFGAEIIAELPKNKNYLISTKIVGAFYKIKIKDGLYGFIADTDIAPARGGDSKENSGDSKKSASKKKNKTKDEMKSQTKKRPFEFAKYRGLELAQIQFKEDTMSLDPKENLLFYGFRLSGMDTLFEGSYVDSHVLAHFGAPSYYEKATGQSADGFILLFDCKWQTVFPQSQNTLLYFGLGPLVKFSKFSVGLNSSGQKEAYDLVDLNIGAALDLGIAQRFDSFALRGEWQYYWEKTQYSGFSLSVQLPF